MKARLPCHCLSYDIKPLLKRDTDESAVSVTACACWGRRQWRGSRELPNLGPALLLGAGFCTVTLIQTQLCTISARPRDALLPSSVIAGMSILIAQ